MNAQVEGTHRAALEPRALGEFSEGSRCPSSGAGGMPSSVGVPSLGIWPQGSVHATAPEEGAPGHLPSLLLLLEPKHTWFLPLDRVPEVGEPQRSGLSPVPVVS